MYTVSMYLLNQKIWGNFYMRLFGDIQNSVHEKSHGILWNSAEFHGIIRHGIQRNFSQFRTEYGIDGSKKNRRNSVSTEFRGHPKRDTPCMSNCPYWWLWKGRQPALTYCITLEIQPVFQYLFLQWLVATQRDREGRPLPTYCNWGE